jgi:hypothetical protein
MNISDIKKLLFLLGCILISLIVGYMIGRDYHGYVKGYTDAIQDVKPFIK